MARPELAQLPRGTQGGGAPQLRAVRRWWGGAVRRGVLRGLPPHSHWPDVVAAAAGWRHLRVDVGGPRVALPGALAGRLRRDRRLLADLRIPAGGRRVPRGPRHHGADRKDRPDRRPLATRERPADRAAEARCVETAERTAGVALGNTRRVGADPDDAGASARGRAQDRTRAPRHRGEHAGAPNRTEAPPGAPKEPRRMIAFGTAVTSVEHYERYAQPGIERASEPDSEVIVQQSMGSLFRNYNLMLDLASELPDLEALVLVHQDTELVDADFCDKARKALADPDVGLV